MRFYGKLFGRGMITRTIQWAYDVTLTWITVRPESPLVFSAHMLLRLLIVAIRRGSAGTVA